MRIIATSTDGNAESVDGHARQRNGMVLPANALSALKNRKENTFKKVSQTLDLGDTAIHGKSIATGHK